MANFYESGYASAAKAAGVSDENEVRRLQESLNAAGAKLEVDGIYGPRTDEAWKKYGSAASPSAAAPAADTASAAAQALKYNTTDTAAYSAPEAAITPAGAAKSRADEAKSYLESVLAAQPAAWDGGEWAAELASAYANAVSRPDFSYDLAADPLWQSYSTRYAELGEQAMMDTMGRAAALTGGYGSSYAQTVGQQQYDAYLEKLSDIAPELYSAAYSRWRDAGNDAWQRFDAASELYDRDYKAYSDAYSDWQTGYSAAKSAENSAFNTMLSAGEDAADARGDAYDRLVKLISATGYDPSAGELDAAGMSRGEAQAWLGKYIADNTPAASQSSGGSGGKSGKAPTDAIMSTAMSLAKSGDTAGLELFCREKTRQGYDGDWLYSTYSAYIPATKPGIGNTPSAAGSKKTADTGNIGSRNKSLDRVALAW